jgi:hypothetical protein
LLLGGDADATLPEGWGGAADDDKGDVDMEITFAPGLSEAKEGDEETTLEAYQRKMRDKRKKRKEEVKGKEKEKGDGHEVERQGKRVKDDFFASESEKEDEAEEQAEATTKKGSKKGKNKPKRTSSPEVKPMRTESTAEELALLATADGTGVEPNHFDMKAVLRAEKVKGRKGKRRGNKTKGEEELQEEFAINVKDDRFKALHEDHTFAIDPSNPQCVALALWTSFLSSFHYYLIVLRRHRAWLLSWTSGQSAERLTSPQGKLRGGSKTLFL